MIKGNDAAMVGVWLLGALAGFVLGVGIASFFI